MRQVTLPKVTDVVVGPAVLVVALVRLRAALGTGQAGAFTAALLAGGALVYACLSILATSAFLVRIATILVTNEQDNVASIVVAHAKELLVDAVVLATHGRGGVRGILFGRIAEQVIRLGDRPVFLVRAEADPGDRSAQAWTCATIAVALDGTPASAALPAMAAVARGFGAALHLVSAVPTVGTVAGESAAAALVPGTTRAVLDLQEGEAANALREVARGLEADGFTVGTAVVRGDPARAIAEEAMHAGADLLVLGSHGRGGVAGIWTGSVTAKLLRRFARPVLLVPLR